MTTTKNTGKEEICDESCDCHSDNTVVVGNNIYTNNNGGSGMSEEMKKLIKFKIESKSK